MINRKTVAATVAVIGMSAYIATAQSPAANMSFFVTSANAKGGNLGGLAGADQVCQSLAKAAGAGNKTWRAYLSTSTVDAKTRIGNGPWYNFKGELIAQNVADLHTADKNKISGTTVAHREGHDAELPRDGGRQAGACRAAVAARHPHRHERGWHQERGHVQGLDGGRRQRQGDARARRSTGAQSRSELVERDPRVAGVRPRPACANRRRRNVVLLRRELTPK